MSDIDADRDLRDPRWLLVVGGAIGLFCAAMLVLEKITFLQAEVDGESTALSCDFNAFVSCGGVINRPEASVFGPPNPLIGVVAFTIVLTLGVLLVSGRSLPEWFWVGMQAGTIFGISLVTWLQQQSIYDIEKLCPYCMVVWAVTIPLFVFVTARNLRAWAPASGVTKLVSDWTVLIVLLWYVVIAAAIWFHFGDLLWA